MSDTIRTCMDREQYLAAITKAAPRMGRFLNPDKDLVNDLVDGILTNKERYGYHNCPCRMAANDKELDKDIICPCVYCDPDVAEFGACYCGLYVSEECAKGTKKVPEHVPERRPTDKWQRY
jgi:ferredoxin-thioredoxin reductase catalytic subunit